MYIQGTEYDALLDQELEQQEPSSLGKIIVAPIMLYCYKQTLLIK